MLSAEKRNRLAQISPPEEIEVQRPCFGLIVEAHSVAGLARIDQGARRIVEEKSVPKVQEKQRNGDVGARSMVDVAIPKTARRSQSIQGLAAVAKAIEMLLADDLEPKP